MLLKDKEINGLSRGESMIAKNLGAKLKRRRMTKYDHDSTLARVVGLTDSSSSWKSHFGRADLVIEAVFEEMGVKHAVVREMEAACADHTIIASNTSTLPIGEIASVAKRPQNIVGMHYFSPVDKMPLLEVIPHAKTDAGVTAAAVAFGIKQVRRLPLAAAALLLSVTVGHRLLLCATGQDGDRREGRAGLLRQPLPRPLPRRGARVRPAGRRPAQAQQG